jgi:hypothetical protein
VAGTGEFEIGGVVLAVYSVDVCHGLEEMLLHGMGKGLAEVGYSETEMHFSRADMSYLIHDTIIPIQSKRSVLLAQGSNTLPSVV